MQGQATATQQATTRAQDGTSGVSSQGGRDAAQDRYGNAALAGTRAGRNPADRVGADGTPATEHLPADVSGAFDGAPPPFGAQGPSEDVVRVLRGTMDPLRVEGTPPEEALIERFGGAEESPQDAVPVDRFYGTVEQPNCARELVPDTLFVGGGPSAADVRQGNLGDCYLLADLVGIAAQDPAHLKGMMTLAGGLVTCTFHRFDAATQTWVPVTVGADASLARDTKDGALVGAGFRLAESPSWSEWFAEAEGGELSIWETQFWEAALWVPLLEKCYARFAEKWGQYGGLDVAGAKGSGGSGYDVVEGGWPAPALRVLYGGAVSETSDQVRFAPDRDLVRANREVIRRLLETVGEGAGVATAMTDDRTVLRRLAALVKRALEEPDALGTTEAAILADLGPELEGWQAAADPERPVHEREIEALAGRLLATPCQCGARSVELAELCRVAVDLQDQRREGRRSIYTDHAYAVTDVRLRDANGAPLDVEPSSLDAQIAEIDAGRSTVEVVNPHGTNEPDRAGDGADDGRDDGRFDLSLDRFFLLFSRMDSGAIGG